MVLVWINFEVLFDQKGPVRKRDCSSSSVWISRLEPGSTPSESTPRTRFFVRDDWEWTWGSSSIEWYQCCAEPLMNSWMRVCDHFFDVLSLMSRSRTNWAYFGNQEIKPTERAILKMLGGNLNIFQKSFEWCLFESILSSCSTKKVENVFVVVCSNKPARTG